MNQSLIFRGVSPQIIWCLSPRQVSTSSSCGTKPPCRNAPNNVPPLGEKKLETPNVFGTFLVRFSLGITTGSLGETTWGIPRLTKKQGTNLRFYPLANPRRFGSDKQVGDVLSPNHLHHVGPFLKWPCHVRFISVICMALLHGFHFFRSWVSCGVVSCSTTTAGMFGNFRCFSWVCCFWEIL